MPGRIRPAALLAALVVALLMCLPAQASARVPNDFWGVDSVHDPATNEFALMHKTGVEVFRMPMSWREIEPKKPTRFLGIMHRNYDWTEPDRLVRRATANGVGLHVGLIDTPAWVNRDARTSPVRTGEGRTGWRDFVRAVLDRYGPGGEFWSLNPSLPVRPPIAYQVWNEQNTSSRYQPRANPAEYAKLLNIAGAEIRAGDPGAEILPGGMFGTPQTEASFTAWHFIKALAKQPGVRSYIDAVGVHPYSPDLRGVRYQLKKMRKALNKSGMRKVPLEVTELGWSSSPHKDKFFFFKGRKGQQRMLKRSIKLMLDHRRKWKLKRILWFSWRDVSTGSAPGCVYCQKFGLLREDLSRKPSYRTFKRLIRKTK